MVRVDDTEYESWVKMTEGMQVPRHPDPNWFIDNGALLNREHPNFDEALMLAKQLTRRTRWDN